MAGEHDPIVAEFVIESREHLADVENQLLAIESGGADIDAELVNTVFRAIHSIKGAAGFLGFSVLGELAHNLENVLNLVRNRELVPDATNVDVMLRAADTLSSMVENITDSNDVDISGHVAELQQVVDGGEPTPVSEAGPTEPEQTTGTAIAETGESSVPAEPQQKNETTATEIVAAEDAPPPVDRKPPQKKPAPAQSSAEKSAPSAAPADTSIRVSVRLLDSLMNLAGELVLSRNQLVQKVGADNTTGLDSVAARLDQITSELQEAIMKTRMQHVGTVFSKFPRVVRDLCRQLEKQCELTIEGEEVELDKSIIEAIGDPLTHLVRNSVDHGIESPQERVEAGKPAQGIVTLRAYHQAGKVNIEISDDGAGIDAARLKEKAVDKGIITAEQAAEMGERETLHLIFHAGFSLAKQVTDVSGRGVGMDVVRTNIERLGGTISIQTELGKGTTISIKLPLTLAIVPSLIVRCHEQRYAIPQTNIRELVRIKGEEIASRIERVAQAEVFRLRGKLLPLVRLHNALDVAESDDPTAASAVNIIVVEAGHLQYGLIVDGLHDSEEIVVKPLGRHMQQCQALAGATILGDGQIALILDVTGIATRSQLELPSDEQRNEHHESRNGNDRESQSTLLFTNHPNELFGVPMAAIARIERVLTSQVDSVGGKEVLQYRGASLPLLRLENHISALACPTEIRKINVVVFSVHGREVGLIVPALVDIRKVSIDVDTVTFREPGVIGSVEVDGVAARLLDLYELTKAACPAWFEGTEGRGAPTPRTNGEKEMETHPPTVLLAEDSGFFRAQVTSYLEEAGYRVVGCEDGLIAWNTLREEPGEFDLIVTDIEMPNMDGCQFSRRVKDDPALAHLPIIALTSLASEEDMQRGIESGIDDYQIKMDRERLMAAAASYLNNAVARNFRNESPALASSAAGKGGQV
jgi:two-component system chemotaxis sensor kinase CheA